MNNLMTKFNKAFTLIELLVVISIISLLASVIIVSVDSARQDARIATIEQNFLTIKTEMELYRTTNNDYATSDLGYAQCQDYLPGGVEAADSPVGSSQYSIANALNESADLANVDINTTQCWMFIDTDFWGVVLDGGDILPFDKNFCISTVNGPGIFGDDEPDGGIISPPWGCVTL